MNPVHGFAQKPQGSIGMFDLAGLKDVARFDFNLAYGEVRILAGLDRYGQEEQACQKDQDKPSVMCASLTQQGCQCFV
jgi:hypothetical protein